MAIDPKIADKIISESFEGISLEQSLKKHGVDRRAFYRCLEENVELSREYARAKPSRADMAAEDIIRIADDENIDVQRARNMIDARKWMASKLLPQVYSDRVEINVTSEVSLVNAIAEGRARLLPLRNPTIDVESQVTDISSIDDERATGSKPVSADNVSINSGNENKEREG